MSDSEPCWLPIRSYLFESSKKFLEALNPASGYFCTYKPGDEFLFRGQGKDWPLLPSSYRSGLQSPWETVLWKGPAKFYPQRTIRAQAFAEIQLLREFARVCSRFGLPLPSHAEQTLEHLNDQVEAVMKDKAANVKLAEWPSPDFHRIIALAQHSALPTCMIDVTRNPYIAAYFAAKGALDLLEEGSQVILWAISLEFLNKLHVKNCGISIVDVAPDYNPNLGAQEAALISWSINLSEKADLLFKPRSLQDIASTKVSEEQCVRSHFLTKYELPVSEAGALLQQLGALGFEHAKLFPSYARAAESVLELRRWWRTVPAWFNSEIEKHRPLLPLKW